MLCGFFRLPEMQFNESSKVQTMAFVHFSVKPQV